MEDIICTNCGHCIGKKVVIRYGEFKCPSCGAINIIDRTYGDKLDKGGNISHNGLVIENP